MNKNLWPKVVNKRFENKLGKLSVTQVKIWVVNKIIEKELSTRVVIISFEQKKITLKKSELKLWTKNFNHSCNKSCKHEFTTKVVKRKFEQNLWTKVFRKSWAKVANEIVNKIYKHYQ